jgi:hypothetical protein
VTHSPYTNHTTIPRSCQDLFPAIFGLPETSQRSQLFNPLYSDDNASATS